MIGLALAALVVGSCSNPEPEPWEADEGYCNTWDGEVWEPEPVAVALSAEAPVVSWRLRAEEPGRGLDSVSVAVDLGNPTEHDCLVALYLTEGEVDLQGIPPADPTTPPPADHPELGVRLLMVNLAQLRGQEDHISEGFLLAEGPGELDLSLTLVGCEEGGVRGELLPYADFCEGEQARPESLSFEAQP